MLYESLNKYTYIFSFYRSRLLPIISS